MEKNKKEFNIPIKVCTDKTTNRNLAHSSTNASGNFNNKSSNQKNWLLKKDEQTRKKAMWIIIGCFMALVVPIWIIFLQETVNIEKLSANAQNNEEYWASLKNNLDESIKNINDGIANFNKQKKVDDADYANANEPANVEAVYEKIKIDDEKIEQLKERLMEKE
ncbi:hypothetical protein ACFL23_00895 [Patescibacteria group bacterium]